MRVPEPGWRLTKRMSSRARSRRPPMPFGLPLPRKSPCLRRVRCTSTMTLRIEPAPVRIARRSREIRRAASETRQFAFAARERADGFGAVAVFDVDAAIVRDQRASPAPPPHSHATRGCARRRAAARASGSVRLPLRSPAPACCRRAARRKTLRTQHRLPEFGQHGPAAPLFRDQRAAQTLLDCAQQTPRMPVGQTLKRRRLRDAAGSRRRARAAARRPTGWPPGRPGPHHQLRLAFDSDHI